MMEKCKFISPNFKNQIKSTFSSIFPQDHTVHFSRGILVTIHKFRIRVQHCHCSSLILMGCKMCVSHPSTHKNCISYLPSSVSQNASVKYISVHLGKNKSSSKKQRDIFTVCCLCKTTCSICAIQKG